MPLIGTIGAASSRGLGQLSPLGRLTVNFLVIAGGGGGGLTNPSTNPGNGGGIWKQASYNGNFRKNYSGVDVSYDQERNAFISLRPFASWILNKTTCQ